MQGLNSTSAARRQQAVLARPEGVSVPAELLAGAVLAESDPNVAGALRWALARSGGDGVAALAAGVQSEDVDIRRRAVPAIAEMSEAPGATAVLADALGDPDTTVRRQAALALGRRGVTGAVPTLVGMVVEGSNDVEAAEVLGTLCQDPGCADRIMTALVDELAAPAADSATRIRLTQALVELSGTTVQDVLRQLAHDDDRAVALVASAFVTVLDERSPEYRGEVPPPLTVGSGIRTLRSSSVPAVWWRPGRWPEAEGGRWSAGPRRTPGGRCPAAHGRSRLRAEGLRPSRRWRSGGSWCLLAGVRVRVAAPGLGPPRVRVQAWAWADLFRTKAVPRGDRPARGRHVISVRRVASESRSGKLQMWQSRADTAAALRVPSPARPASSPFVPRASPSVRPT
ncbi:HEAT repeat domain-containing protein [Streptomyces sp. NBC_01136]|uniref:HEAT repeat domain-containing protein n=1 Tax=unclassified Streptomyces TaxID=2593676 RepID=UPI0032493F0C|nr:HEAT repeat domain-containing protein [Streptomyces sp. NBC_01136]